MPADSRKIFIGNLPDQCSIKDIEDLFYEHGKIKNVEMKIARGNKPFCFLTFESSEEADIAVQIKNGYIFKEKPLRVDHTRDDTYITPGPSLKGKYKVKVKGLPYSASWQDLKDFMRKAAEVGYAKIIKRGVGLIEFPKKSDMYYAIQQLDGTEFKNHFDSAYVRIRRYYSDEERSRSRSRSRHRHRHRNRHRRHHYSSPSSYSSSSSSLSSSSSSSSNTSDSSLNKSSQSDKSSISKSRSRSKSLNKHKKHKRHHHRRHKSISRSRSSRSHSRHRHKHKKSHHSHSNSSDNEINNNNSNNNNNNNNDINNNINNNINPELSQSRSESKDKSQ